MIGAAVLMGLIAPVALLWRFVPLDPNEGWNAFFAQIALQGGDLYASSGGTIINNYPPLSFYIVGSIGHLTGDNIFAGRAVALISMFVVAGNIFLWLRTVGASARVAWLGAGIFAAFALTYARSYAGMDDPQWLAHALMTSGMVVLWRGNASTRAILLGSMLILAGGWTKHLLIPLPIAVTWWLMRRSRSAFLTWAACCALLLAAISLLVWRMFGSSFFDSLLAAREFSRHQAIVRFRWALQCLAPIIALTLLLIPRARHSESAEFALAYALIAALVAVASSGGVGVDINAYFDVVIAASLCAALAAQAFWRRRLSGSVPDCQVGPAVTLLLGSWVVIYAGSLLHGTLRDLHSLNERERDTLAAVRFIAASGGGRAACEAPALCYWGKNRFMLDFFNYGQRLKLGKQPTLACAAVFDGKYIPLLQLNSSDGRGSKQLPPSCSAIIQQNYRPIWVTRMGAMLSP